MRFLFFGDVLGRAGRTAILDHIPSLRDRLNADAVIINGENTAAGFGITGKLADEFLSHGVDIISGGNHTFDQKEILPRLDSDTRLLRPLNYPPGTPGRGITTLDVSGGRKIVVISVLARTFMQALDCPFRAVDQALKTVRLGSQRVAAILVDFHGDATSEKMAMGHYLDGRVSAVIGTHSHVPTADAQILDGGTAYQTDAGMCGDYNSVIGMQKDEPVQRFVSRIPKGRFTPALGEATLCGVMVDTDDKTGLATQIEPIRLGPRLINTQPR